MNYFCNYCGIVKYRGPAFDSFICSTCKFRICPICNNKNILDREDVKRNKDKTTCIYCKRGITNRTLFVIGQRSINLKKIINYVEKDIL